MISYRARLSLGEYYAFLCEMSLKGYESRMYKGSKVENDGML